MQTSDVWDVFGGDSSTSDEEEEEEEEKEDGNNQHQQHDNSDNNYHHNIASRSQQPTSNTGDGDNYNSKILRRKADNHEHDHHDHHRQVVFSLITHWLSLPDHQPLNQYRVGLLPIAEVEGEGGGKLLLPDQHDHHHQQVLNKQPAAASPSAENQQQLGTQHDIDSWIRTLQERSIIHVTVLPRLYYKDIKDEVVLLSSTSTTRNSQEDATQQQSNNNQFSPSLNSNEKFDAIILVHDPDTNSQTQQPNSETRLNLLCRITEHVVPGGWLIGPRDTLQSLLFMYSSDDTMFDKKNIHPTAPIDQHSHSWIPEEWQWNSSKTIPIKKYSISKTATTSDMGTIQNGNDNNSNNTNDISINSSWSMVMRQTCRIQHETCPWLPRYHNIQEELYRLQQVVVTMTSHEIQVSQLSQSSIQRAVQSIETYGLTVIRGGLISPQDSSQYGQAILQDLDHAAHILLHRDQVNLYEPGINDHHNVDNDDTNNIGNINKQNNHPTSVMRIRKHEPTSYQELSMREDYRMDIRHGPQIQQIRGLEGSQSRIISAEIESTGDYLRGHVSLLAIVRQVMNPQAHHQGLRTDETNRMSSTSSSYSLSSGNFGRFNFHGRGPDGTCPDIRVGPVGGLVSLPGSADQAIHADTPHLFEHISSLPAHYMNIFTPGCPAGFHVGQTAFICGSHQLDFTAKYCNYTHMDRPTLWKHLVRPRLDLGDVLLFDCRILHFGLANMTNRAITEGGHVIRRPLLYTNITLHWFHDPKNWDQEKSIFKE